MYEYEQTKVKGRQTLKHRAVMELSIRPDCAITRTGRMFADIRSA